MTPEERRKKVKELRESGMTYRKIGKEIGVSAERVRQILRRQAFIERVDKGWPEELDEIAGHRDAIRIKNLLLRNKINTIEELKKRTPQEIKRMGGVGKKTLKTIMRIRGEVDEESIEKKRQIRLLAMSFGETKKEDLRDVESSPVLDTLEKGMKQRIINILWRRGITRLEELMEQSPKKIMLWRGVGKASFAAIMKVREEAWKEHEKAGDLHRKGQGGTQL